MVHTLFMMADFAHKLSNGIRYIDPTSLSKGAKAAHEPSSTSVAIPATAHCPSYSSAFLSELANSPNFKPGPFGKNPIQTHFAHLPCSLIANSSAPPPTVVALKQHIQALCHLLSRLEPAPPNDAPHQSLQRALPSPTFDFLTNLLVPCWSNDPAANRPVASLANQHPSAAEFYASSAGSHRHASEPAKICPLSLDPASRTLNHIRAHVNKLLTYLDHRYAANGGILSMTPAPAAAHTLLGQWVLYTSRLVARVAELEREVVNLREVLGHEVLVAGVRARARPNENGESSAREMLFPQDRYVLAGLSDALWLGITEALSISAEEAIDREIATGARMVRGSGPFTTTAGAGAGSNLATGGEQASYGNIVSWVETTARLYRVRGHETVFVIPAWDMHPGSEAVRAVEQGPLVTSLPKLRSSGAGTPDEWRTVGVSAHERETEAETTRLWNEVASLKRGIEQVKNEHEDEKRLRRKAEERAERAEARLHGEKTKNGFEQFTNPRPTSSFSFSSSSSSPSPAAGAAGAGHNKGVNDNVKPTTRNHINSTISNHIDNPTSDYTDSPSSSPINSPTSKHINSPTSTYLDTPPAKHIRWAAQTGLDS